MEKIDLNVSGFIQYGLPSDLSDRAANAGLTVSKVRTLSIKNLLEKFGLTRGEAKELKDAVKRTPIDEDTLHALLERSNFTCNVCKGTKSSAFIVHHIEPYAKTQNNKYHNLIVLCPNDHDLAHRGGLTMGISSRDLIKLKGKWEDAVDLANAQKAAHRIDVSDSAIDYVNIRRIEELCLQLFKKLPTTNMTTALQAQGILGLSGSFQQKFVRENLSNGSYLFDYINSGETLHYHELMRLIANNIDFCDLSDAIDHGWKAVSALEGHYAFFIGGVYSKRPHLPITSSTSPIIVHYTKRKIRVEWVLDPNFMMSMSAISRLGGKNRYIIYCLVRTVDHNDETGETSVKASPFFIAQPTTHKNRTPAIGFDRLYGHLYDAIEEDGLDES